MNVTIEQAIEEITVLQTALKEGGFLHETLNMAKGALKTIKDGNYQLPINTVSRETLKEMADFNCKGLDCEHCIYRKATEDGGFTCMSIKAKDVIWYQQNIKEVEEWINQNLSK